MATKRVPENEISFRIDAFSPDTLPMARLADYVAALAAFLGEKEHVHFRRVGKGSADLIQMVEPRSLAAVRRRIDTARATPGTDEGYKRIDAILASDKAAGVLRVGGAKVIDFPGRKHDVEPRIGPIAQEEYLDGQLVRVGGLDATVPVHLRDTDGIVRYCTTTVETARRLGPYVYGQPIRVYGTGTWYREPDGAWTLEQFKVRDFESLDNTPLAEAVSKLRTINGQGLPDGINETIELLRME